MKCPVVVAHPDAASLCHSVAQSTIRALADAGHQVEVEDLYQAGFPPSMTPAERQSYYLAPFDASLVKEQIGRLLDAEALVLVFPTWWFGFPAILKGWFDRVWAPGVAYDHGAELGPIRPRLDRLRQALVVTSLGSPWWVDRLVLRQPVRRILRTALLGTCARACRFEMMSLYKAERLSAGKVQAFRARLGKTLARWS